MPLTMTLADLGNGTGGTATIAGSSGATNQVYYTAFDGTSGSRTWTLGGSITGDGDVSLAIGVGYFEFQLVSNGSLGPISSKNFTDQSALDALHYQYLQGSKVRASQLTFPVL